MSCIDRSESVGRIEEGKRGKRGIEKEEQPASTGEMSGLERIFGGLPVSCRAIDRYRSVVVEEEKRVMSLSLFPFTSQSVLNSLRLDEDANRTLATPYVRPRLSLSSPCLD